jgi:hypothetical protein
MTLTVSEVKGHLCINNWKWLMDWKMNPDFILSHRIVADLIKFPQIAQNTKSNMYQEMFLCY